MPDENTTIQVKRSFFEDDNADIHFFYTGKDSVIGLAHPDKVYTNDAGYDYIRVAFYKFYTEDTTNTTIININETLDITLIPTDAKALAGIDSCKFKIAFSAHGRGMRVLRDTVKCTVIYNITSDDEDVVEERVIVTEDSYKDENNIVCYGVGIWVYTPNMKYACINVDGSMSVNSMPIDVPSHPSPYIAEYLDDNIKEQDVNMYRSRVFLESGDRIILIGEDATTATNNRLEDLEQKTQYEPHLFTQNTLMYDPVYNPERAGMEYFVNATQIRGPVTDRIVVSDMDQKGFKVTQPGIYALQLKNGFYLIQGNSRVDLNVYINGEMIREMRICSYLESNLHGENLLIDPYRLGDEYWSYRGTIEREQEDPYGGNCAVKLIPTDVADNWFGTNVSTNRPITTTGQTYKCSVWLKAEASCNIRIALNGQPKEIAVGPVWRQYTNITSVTAISNLNHFMVGGSESIKPSTDNSIYIYNPVVDIVDDVKTVKNTYSSNVYVVKLIPDDLIRLGVRFMNIDNLVLENETMLSVTALQYNV